MMIATNPARPRIENASTTIVGVCATANAGCTACSNTAINPKIAANIINCLLMLVNGVISFIRK